MNISLCSDAIIIAIREIGLKIRVMVVETFKNDTNISFILNFQCTIFINILSAIPPTHSNCENKLYKTCWIIWKPYIKTA